MRSPRMRVVKRILPGANPSLLAGLPAFQVEKRVRIPANAPTNFPAIWVYWLDSIRAEVYVAPWAVGVNVSGIEQGEMADRSRDRVVGSTPLKPPP
jgi:hypothetical protein